ncbi:cyanophycinase [Sphingobacterium spiritivorum]|uniref:cyanophycinase n=1 Tax=Sphingobacterium spiritivorum TaxID=258 RepID=UPI003DA67C3E
MKLKFTKALLIIGLGCLSLSSFAKETKEPKGSLFIIGGGAKDSQLIRSMVDAAALSASDYIMILPMASTVADASVADIKEQLQEVTDHKITAINFSKADASDLRLVDSVRKAKLIYITGGDQNRFMAVVEHSPLFDAIHSAYQQGACIAGTSAGAAIMSDQMITGEQAQDSTYRATFNRLNKDNLVTAKGMGLIRTAIIDQHFIKRSRYNRLFSALAEQPDKVCIGIDESTAILIHNKKAKVVGQFQVVVASNPVKLEVNKEGRIIWDDIRLSIYDNGKTFPIQ